MQPMTSKRPPIPSESALGVVSTRSFPAIVGVADYMLKAAAVRLIGYEKIGSGYCTAVVRGNISDVRLAVEAGIEFAERVNQLVSHSVISRPLANLEAVLPISDTMSKLAAEQGYSRLSNQAVGLLETRGFPAMVGAADAMLKAAEIYFSGYELVGDGLCTAVIRGQVSDVTVAIEVGMHEAERIGELHSVMIIPRPLEDLEETLPTAKCWIDQPLALPIELKQTEKELVAKAEKTALPDLQQLQMPEPDAATELPDLRDLATPEPVELPGAEVAPAPQRQSMPIQSRPLDQDLVD